MKGLWAISSFEPSADEIAAKFLGSACAAGAQWIGYDNRPYSDRLNRRIVLPAWAAGLGGRIGLGQVAIRIFQYYRLIRLITKALAPMALTGIIVVDYPSFHTKLITRLRDIHPALKVVFVSPPKTWATRSWRNRWIQRCVNACVVLYEHEKKYFEKRRIPVIWVRDLSDPSTNSRAPTSHATSDHVMDVVVYPGSRLSEIKAVLPVVDQACRQLCERGHPVRAHVSVLPQWWRERRRLYPPNVHFHYFCGEMAPLNARAIAWVCSGTMTVRAASLGLPMIVMYPLSGFSHFLLRVVLGYRGYFAIPNLVFEKEVYPELIGLRLTSTALARAHLKLWDTVCRQPDHFRRVSDMWRQRRDQAMTWETAATDLNVMIGLSAPSGGIL